MRFDLCTLDHAFFARSRKILTIEERGQDARAPIKNYGGRLSAQLSRPPR